MATAMERDGDEYVISGRKWWTHRGGDPRCAVADRDGRDRPGRRRASPAVDGARTDRTPGVTVERDAAGVGYPSSRGTPRSATRRARAGREPARGGGRGLPRRPGAARARAGSTTACGRSGMTERALELMRAAASLSRDAFGRPIAAQGVDPRAGSPSRGSRSSRRGCSSSRPPGGWTRSVPSPRQSEIAAIKVVAARLACRVTDRAIQAFGGAGVSERLPARGDVRGRAHAAARRRAGRGAPADGRQA